jgi:type IV fimbrial biogenesis protein FimT
MTQKNPKTAVGVTLIELLVTMSVLVILLTVAVPQLGFMVAHNARSAEVNTLIGHLNFARSLAISRGISICVCRVNRDDATTCTTGSAWSDGYAVFVEGDGAPLRFHKGSKTIDITDSADKESSAHEFCFKDDGSVRVPATLTFSDVGGVADPVEVVVSRVGRVLFSEGTNTEEDPEEVPEEVPEEDSA